MEVIYQSTRDSSLTYSASQAILAGIAPDGGLFVPSSIPKLPVSLTEVQTKSYQELAYLVLQAFLPDFTESELDEVIQVYDTQMDDPAITPLKEAAGKHYLELFHGPTIAFKDMALLLLPKLMTIAAKKNGLEKDIVILTATSGDTGKAALVGFADVPRTHIIVFYPKNGVSEIQEKQMATQKGDNVHVVAIEGNFDDAQTKVKELFADVSLQEELSRQGFQFSSANSINIGRLVPQIIYYIYAYGQLLQDGKVAAGEPFNITVPTGNFGNILAAYYAKQMGLPVGKLIVASNENNVLTDFFQTGTYDRKRDFVLTSSPSMDILVSSNLERLLYHLSGEDTQLIKKYMSSLSQDGQYRITADMLEKAGLFHAGFATEADVRQHIKQVADEAQYVLDPHTAVASFVAEQYQKETGDAAPMVIASTASPYKFPAAVLEALEPGYISDNIEDLLAQLKQHTKIPYPPAIEEALHDPIRHNRVISIDQMKEAVRESLNVR